MLGLSFFIRSSPALSTLMCSHVESQSDSLSLSVTPEVRGPLNLDQRCLARIFLARCVHSCLGPRQCNACFYQRVYPSKQSCKQPNHRRDINKNRAEINKRKRRIFALSSVYSLSTISGSSSSLNFLSTSLTILSHLVAFQNIQFKPSGARR